MRSRSLCECTEYTGHGKTNNAWLYHWVKVIPSRPKIIQDPPNMRFEKIPCKQTPNHKLITWTLVCEEFHKSSNLGEYSIRPTNRSRKQFLFSVSQFCGQLNQNRGLALWMRHVEPLEFLVDQMLQEILLFRLAHHFHHLWWMVKRGGTRRLKGGEKQAEVKGLWEACDLCV